MEPRRLTKTRKIWSNSAGGSLAVTLPSEICDLFGWKGGDEVAFLVNQNCRQLILEKANDTENEPKASDQETTRSGAGEAA